MMNTSTEISLLLVEDDPDFRDISARWMRRKGHRVVAVASGDEALKACQETDFQVGVFDLNMPGMSGLELLSRIRGEKVSMEVIILTGQGSIESAVKAMKIGANDYLTKPCSLDDLERHCLMAVKETPTQTEEPKISHSDKLDDVSKAHVLEILERENGNKARTARLLGIHRRKLYRLLERFQSGEITEADHETELS